MRNLIIAVTISRTHKIFVGVKPTRRRDLLTIRRPKNPHGTNERKETMLLLEPYHSVEPKTQEATITPP